MQKNAWQTKKGMIYYNQDKERKILNTRKEKDYEKDYQH